MEGQQIQTGMQMCTRTGDPYQCIIRAMGLLYPPSGMHKNEIVRKPRLNIYSTKPSAVRITTAALTVSNLPCTTPGYMTALASGALANNHYRLKHPDVNGLLREALSNTKIPALSPAYAVACRSLPKKNAEEYCDDARIALIEVAAALSAAARLISQQDVSVTICERVIGSVNGNSFNLSESDLRHVEAAFRSATARCHTDQRSHNSFDIPRRLREELEATERNITTISEESCNLTQSEQIMLLREVYAAKARLHPKHEANKASGAIAEIAALANIREISAELGASCTLEAGLLTSELFGTLKLDEIIRLRNLYCKHQNVLPAEYGLRLELIEARAEADPGTKTTKLKAVVAETVRFTYEDPVGLLVLHTALTELKDLIPAAEFYNLAREGLSRACNTHVGFTLQPRFAVLVADAIHEAYFDKDTPRADLESWRKRAGKIQGVIRRFSEARGDQDDSYEETLASARLYEVLGRYKEVLTQTVVQASQNSGAINALRARASFRVACQQFCEENPQTSIDLKVPADIAYDQFRNAITDEPFVIHGFVFGLLVSISSNNQMVSEIYQARHCNEDWNLGADLPELKAMLLYDRHIGSLFWGDYDAYCYDKSTYTRPVYFDTDGATQPISELITQDAAAFFGASTYNQDTISTLVTGYITHAPFAGHRIIQLLDKARTQDVSSASMIASAALHTAIKTYGRFSIPATALRAYYMYYFKRNPRSA